MPSLKFFLLALLLISKTALCQKVSTPEKDSLQASVEIMHPEYHFSYKKVIIPAVLISYGVIGLKSDGLEDLNQSTRFEINEHGPDHIRLDNYTQYAPAAALLTMTLAGVPSKHTLREQSLLFASSQLLVTAMVTPLKHVAKEMRPDASNNLSFPSGHTATAFANAHLFFREYKDRNVWLAVSAYPMSAFTGIYRTLNDKHWVSDVIAGAGFGILATEISYWLFPILSKIVYSNKNHHSQIAVLPGINGKSMQFGIVAIF